MFQKAADDLKQNGEKLNIDDRKIKILKEIFKVQNLITYIISFFVSTITIRGDIAPFAMATFAACCGAGIPIIGVLIIIASAVLVSQGSGALVTFIVTAILYISIVLIRKPIMQKEKNEVVKTGTYLVIALIIVKIIRMINGEFYLYDSFMSVIEIVLTYVFYKIFVNGLEVIKNIGIKRVFSKEELIAATLLCSMGIFCFSGIKIFDISIGNVLIIFMILVLGWKNGAIVGATSGLAISTVLGIIGAISPVQIAAYGVAGLIAGVLNKLGKIGVIIGFILGNAILTYIYSGNIENLIYYKEILIASIGLLVIPRNLSIKLDEIFLKDKLLDNKGEIRLNPSEILIEKVEEITNAIKELGNTSKNFEMPKDFENLKTKYIEELTISLEDVENNILYEEISDITTGIAEEIYKTLIKNEILVEKDLIEIFENKNSYLVVNDSKTKEDINEVIKIINRTYRTTSIKLAVGEEKLKQKSNATSQVKNVTEAIKETTKKEIKRNKNTDKELELIEILKQKEIFVENLEYTVLENGKNIIKITTAVEEDSEKNKLYIKWIEDILSKYLKDKIGFQRDKTVSRTSKYVQIYSSEDKYTIQLGTAKTAKEGNKVSGDTDLEVRLEDGRYLIALSDGKGSGADAKEASKSTIQALKTLMQKGAEYQTSIKLINTITNMNNEKDMYATLDTLILDLFAGNMRIIKNGACNTYIKNKKNIKIVKSKDLPVGIIEDINIEESICNVNDGDIVIMYTDGICDSKESTGKEWIEDFIKNVNTNNVQKMADLIMNEAIDNSYGIAKDDMSVIVLKIVKKAK